MRFLLQGIRLHTFQPRLASPITLTPPDPTGDYEEVEFDSIDEPAAKKKVEDEFGHLHHRRLFKEID